MDVSAGVLAFSRITCQTLAAVFDRDEFRLERVWKKADKPAWAYQGKQTKKRARSVLLVKQKLRICVVTFLSIYRK